jgi:hypothetical protein
MKAVYLFTGGGDHWRAGRSNGLGVFGVCFGPKLVLLMRKD